MHLPKMNAKLLIIALLALLLLGVKGVLAILWFQWMAGWRFALDDAHKHGINHSESSRLGGLAVFSAVLIFMLWGGVTDLSRYVSDVERSGSHPYGFLAIALCAFVGLSEIVDLMTVNLSDLFLLFIYAEVLGMVAIFYKDHRIPVTLPIIIAITALTRMIVLQTKELEPINIVFEASGILLLAIAA